MQYLLDNVINHYKFIIMNTLKNVNFKLGDKARIMACLNGHKFKIGTIVTISHIYDNDYGAKLKNNHYWYVNDDELEPL